ncbi:hypothetical protein GCM10011579_034170 [Streptomyces albiflavescens]|uniref:Uncharacterized protein n=1 Tax=Streptomyces albiflavescens TaxID=1623582 RepID=A0A918D4N4_9ACTN|nr:hypothetical protein [Streptomyces albiflavescens]GGN64604.1 hypothetical protein GCM10011579_034170 [Streptomyces albiflavescens]
MAVIDDGLLVLGERDGGAHLLHVGFVELVQPFSVCPTGAREHWIRRGRAAQDLNCMRDLIPGDRCYGYR